MVGVMARKHNFNINFLILFFWGVWVDHAHICSAFDIPGTLLFTIYTFSFLYLSYSNNHTPFLATFTWELGTHLPQGRRKFRKSVCLVEVGGGGNDILHYYYSKINLFYISIGEK